MSKWEVWMDLADVFSEISKKMQIDINETRAVIEHPGSKGTILEETFKDFLRRYLPRSLDISSGILVDSDGGKSRQLDVIISDSFKSPIFYSKADIRVMPVECANVVFEVKARLDTPTIDGIIENMLSVRQLKKIAHYSEGFTSLYGVEHWESWPINYYVFAYDSINIKKLAKYIDNKHKALKLPEYSRIDTICVLNKGVIANVDGYGNYDALPTPGSTICFWETEDALLLFYMLIFAHLQDMRFPKLTIPPYIKRNFQNGIKIDSFFND